MADKLLIDCSSGEQQVVELTSEEVAVFEEMTARGIAEQQVNDAITAVFVSGETKAKAIPGWASWTEAEALTWHDTNIANALPVANLSEANALLAKLETENRALVRLVLALRNRVFPNLEGSG